MIESIIIYTIVFFIFFSLARNNVRNATYISVQNVSFWRGRPFITVYSVALILLFTFFCAVRFNVGKDYLSYLAAYNLSVHDLDFWATHWERGFYYIVLACMELHLPPPYMFGLVALIQIVFFLLAFRREQYLWPWILLFVCLNGGFLIWMNGLRQSIALCIWMFSIYFVEEKKILLYFVLCLLAMQFHGSAIILFLFYPLLMNGKSYFKSIPLQYLLLFSALIIQQFFMQVFGGVIDLYISVSGQSYEHYLESGYQYGKGNTGIAYWTRFLIHCIIIFYSERMRLFYNSKRFNIVYTIYFLGILAAYAIPQDRAILSRAVLYITFWGSIMMGYLVYYLSRSKEKNDNYIMIGLIFLVVCIFMGSQIVANKYSSVWYQFYFNQPENIFMLY